MAFRRSGRFKVSHASGPVSSHRIVEYSLMRRVYAGGRPEGLAAPWAILATVIRISSLLATLLAASVSSLAARAAAETILTVEWHFEANLSQRGAWRVDTVKSAGPVQIHLDAEGKGTSEPVQPSVSAPVVLLGSYASGCELGAEENPPIRFVVTRDEIGGGHLWVRIDDGGQIPLRHLSCKFGGGGATDVPLFLVNMASGPYVFRKADLEPGKPFALDRRMDVPATATFKLVRDEIRVTMSR
jgi:hypothetical protein